MAASADNVSVSNSFLKSHIENRCIDYVNRKSTSYMIPSAPNFTEANKGNTSKFAKNLFMPKTFPSVTSESEAKIKHLEPFTIN